MGKQTKTQASQAQEEPKKQPEAQDAYAWEDDAPTGFEGTRAEDMGIPFLTIIQKGSPEVDKDHKDYELKAIEDAETGMIFNSLSRKLVYHLNEDEPLLVIPMYHERLYVEWKPRNEGGGFVQAHRTPVILTKCFRNSDNKDELPNGNVIHTTSYMYCYYLQQGITQPDYPDEGLRPVRAMVGLTGMQLKKAKMWLNMADAIKINGKRPPLYSHIYDITTQPEENAKGNWRGWKFEINRPLTQDDVSFVVECKKVVADLRDNQKLLSAPPPAPEDTGGGSSVDEMAEAEGRRANNRR